MKGLIDAFLKHNQAIADNGRRLEQQNNDSKKIRRAAGTENLIATLRGMEEERQQQMDANIRFQNETLKIENKKLAEALDRAEEFARHKFLECKGLRATISHLSEVWDTPEAGQIFGNNQKIGELMFEKEREILTSSEIQEQANISVAVAIGNPRKRPGNM